MKKTDIALIIIIISMSAGIAYWVASLTIGKSNDKPIVVRTADAINVDEVKVDEAVFSKNAINPTVETTISGEDLTSFVDGEAPTAESADEVKEGTSPNAEVSDPDQQVDEAPAPEAAPQQGAADRPIGG